MILLKKDEGKGNYRTLKGGFNLLLKSIC